MNDSVKKFYSEFLDKDPDKGHFYKVMALHEMPDLEWRSISKEIPLLSRGWFELSRFSVEDRIEFIRDYWLSKMVLSPHSTEKTERFFNLFFGELEEIGLYATQQSSTSPFDVHMVYSLKRNQGFFHGYPPASKESVLQFQRHFATIEFPSDYLNFLEIHDGFSKYTDRGLIKIREMAKTYLRFQERLNELNRELGGPSKLDFRNLIPFYESFGLHCYQCFYSSRRPEGGMENLYFAAEELSLGINPQALEDTLSFDSFIEWLIFYLDDTTHLDPNPNP